MGESLAGRTVLITGAAGGIGRVLVAGFLDAGAAVVATDVTEAGLASLAEAAGKAGHAAQLTTRRLDISDCRACAAVVDETVARRGRLDVLVNNGALGMGAIRADHLQRLVGIEEIAPETWDRFVAVNLSGAWYLTRAAVPHMRRQKHGRILTVTTSFFTMLRGGFHPYGPLKAGLEAMAAGHAQEFAGTGITVNVVVPGGPADTPMIPAESGIDRGALVSPLKMLPPMLWLASDAAAAVTGKRYVAAHWDGSKPPSQARIPAEAPIAWPELAASPVWPGGKPNT